MDIQIIIAAHKKYRMPEDNIYLPVHVGAEGKESIGYVPDNTGDNISGKNANYCELTGLYWAWKNVHADYIGLAHYRRHFSASGRKRDPFDSILNKEQAEELLQRNDIILPKRRNYYIDTLQSHYNHVKLALDSDIPTLGKVINEKYPDYLPAFDKCMNRTWGHMFNMFIMKRELANEYCSWLFDILAELENRVDMSPEIHPGRRRVIGYLSEFLIDIWIEKNGYSYKEIKTVFMERQNEVKKVYKFLIRRFRKK
ncbi:MAG: DUF4422 domain-containing protein [Clostridiales bacterium]|nr:DUF4422 domain-containing protein [Clostridiales bacterium]